MAIIVPGVCRYTIHGTYGGREIANVLDYRIDTTGEITARADAIEDMAGVLINEWSDHVLSWVDNGYSATSVTWVDLDEADGTVGERTSTGQETWPQAGVDVGPAFPGNVAVLWRKVGAPQRGARSGRMYIVGCPEDYTDDSPSPNRLNATTLAGTQTNATSFLGNTNQSGGGYESDLVVVTTTARDEDGHPTAGVGRVVESLVVDATLATQRRRLRG